MFRCSSPKIASGKSFDGRSALLTFEWIALLLPSDGNGSGFHHLPFSESYWWPKLLIYFLPLGSTFQRTLFSDRRLSFSVGVTRRVPAPALPAGRLSPVRSGSRST